MKRHVLTEAERAEVVRLRKEEGKQIGEIMDTMGVSQTTVNRVLRAAGVSQRRQSSQSKKVRVANAALRLAHPKPKNELRDFAMYLKNALKYKDITADQALLRLFELILEE